MKKTLRNSFVLLAIFVAGCASAPVKIGGVLAAMMVASNEVVSSEIAQSSYGENASPHLASIVPAKAVGTAATHPNSFTVFFNFDSDSLSADQTDTISTVVDAAKGGKQIYLFISGHADRAGPRPYNVSLSRSRAQKVKEVLIQLGLKRNWITIAAYGETRPRVFTPDGIREPRNRRVEIILGAIPAL